jgi:hypothetical protein
MCLPPDAQINFDDESFAKTSGDSPNSSTREGTILQMSISAWSARDSTRSMLGGTPGGPIIQCSPKREGRSIFMIIPAPWR